MENSQTKVIYTSDDLFIKRKDKLLWGNYAWWVVSKDLAGNTTKSDTQYIHIGTTSSNFSHTFFPLIVNREQGTVNSQQGNSFWGIAPFGTKVRLTINKVPNSPNSPNLPNNIVFDSITTANPSSGWGINIPGGFIQSGSYTIKVSSTNNLGDYNERELKLANP